MDLTVNLVESMLSSPFCLFLCFFPRVIVASLSFIASLFLFPCTLQFEPFFFLGLFIREAFKWCVPVPNNIMYRFLTYTCLFILFVTNSLIIGTHFLSTSAIIYTIYIYIYIYKTEVSAGTTIFHISTTQYLKNKK